MKAIKQKVPELRFPHFREEWMERRLLDVSKITTGNTPSTSKKEFYNGDYLFISPADLNGVRHVVETNTTLTEKGFNKTRRVKSGSIFFVCIGSTIGKIGQATKNCATNQQINSLTGNKETYNDFIYSLLERKASKIKLLAGTQAVPQINKTDFSKLKFYFPTFPEQQKIATFLSSTDQKIDQLLKKKDLLEQYKKGMMQKIFKQEIRFKDENGKDFPIWEQKKIGKLFDFK